MKPLLESLKALGPARLGAMGAVAIGVLAMLVFLTTGGSHPQMALLYGDVDLHEAGEMVDALDKAHIPHELAGQGDKILVPAADVLSARLLLAKSGLPSGGSVGYEIFDRADSLTQTQFEQTINQTRARGRIDALDRADPRHPRGARPSGAATSGAVRIGSPAVAGQRVAVDERQRTSRPGRRAGRSRPWLSPLSPN